MNLLDELLAAQIVVLGISFIVWGFACALALFAMAFIVAVRNARRGIFDGGSCRAETVTDFLGGLLR